MHINANTFFFNDNFGVLGNYEYLWVVTLFENSPGSVTQRPLLARRRQIETSLTLIHPLPCDLLLIKEKKRNICIQIVLISFY